MHGSLRTALSDWIDIDGAQHELALSMGLVSPGISLKTVYPKAVYWSDNPVGNCLYSMLESLAHVGILERRDEPDIQYRWNADFQAEWERTWCR